MAEPKKRRNYGLLISPKEALEALKILQKYVAERAKAVETKKIETKEDAIQMMDAIDQFRDAVKVMVKTPAEALYDTLRFQTVPSLMEADNTLTTTIAGIGRVNLKDDIQLKTVDKEGLFKWLRDNDKEDIITESVNAGTLAAFVRGQIKEDKPYPGDAILAVKPIVRAEITRGK